MSIPNSLTIPSPHPSVGQPWVHRKNKVLPLNDAPRKKKKICSCLNPENMWLLHYNQNVWLRILRRRWIMRVATKCNQRGFSEEVIEPWRQRLDWSSHKLRNARSLLKRQVKDIPLKLPQWPLPCQHLDFRPLASRTVKEWIPIVLSHQLYGNLGTATTGN